MEQVILKDLFQQRDDRSTSLFKYAIKQLSRCRFSCTEERCELIALYKEEKYRVIVTNEVSLQEIRERIFLFSINDEPSVKYFINAMVLFIIENSENTLMSALKKYKNKNYMPGKKYNDKYYYKFYSKTPLKSSLRDSYNAKWIDYEKQLENGNIIFDELGVAGLFAMSGDTLFKAFNEVVKECYGSSLFILRLLDDQEYFCDGKEIIGERFEVIKKYDLENPKINEIGDFVKEMIKENTRKHELLLAEKDNKINELNHALSELREENTALFKIAYRIRSQRNIIIGLVLLVLLMFYIIPTILQLFL